MRRGFLFVFCFINSLLIDIQLFAQKQQRIELINTDVLKFDKKEGVGIRKLIGNVVFRQDTTMMFCDSAYQYIDENKLELLANVRIIVAPQTTLSADRIEYFGNTKVAELYDNIVLKDGASVLKTNRMTYYRTQGFGYYQNGGTLFDSTNILTSVYGYYFTNSKMAHFKKEITLQSTDYNLTTDSLHYHSQTETAFFVAPTHILTKDSLKLYTERGYYQTVTRKLFAYQNPYFMDKDYSLAADTIFYDYKKDSGWAHCSVRMQTADTTLYIYGEWAIFKRKNKDILLTENPYLLQFLAEDTMILFADTLHSFRDSLTLKDRLTAYYNVQVALRQLQGRADSMVYFTKDSILQLLDDPILWSDNNQLTGDTIWILMKNKKADSIWVRKNGFLASQETNQFFNQLKGKQLQAKLLNNRLNKMLLIGNSESIYFMKDGAKWTGMNRSFSDKIEIEFKENKPQKIVFHTQPTATFSPIYQIYNQANTLEGFEWRITEKPNRGF